MPGISLADLEFAAQPVAEIGRDEVTFTIEGTTVTMRTLYPEEEVEVQRYASAAYDDATDDNAAFIVYSDRFRVAILSYAIIQLGALNLRGVDTIASGETLPNGRPIVTPKDQALRTLLLKWDRVLRLRMFHRHFEIVDRAERRAEQAIQLDPSDLDTEIERLKSRIVDLETEKARRTEGNKELFREFYKAVHQHGVLAEDLREGLKPEAREVAPAPVVERATAPAPVVPAPAPVPAPVIEAAPAPRQSILPQQAVPPAPITPVQAAPVQAAPVQARVAVEADPLAHVRSSFSDLDDPDALEEESRRFLENRRQAQAGMPSESQSGLGGGAPGGGVPQRHLPRVEQVIPRRTPPHAAAQATAQELDPEFQARAEQMRLAAEANDPSTLKKQFAAHQIGETADGIPVVMEREATPLLTPASRGSVQGQPLNTPTQGYRNPRFQSRKG